MTTRMFRLRKRPTTPRRNLDVPATPVARRFKQNGQVRFGWRQDEESMRSCLSIFVDLYRHHATVFAKYCAERRCSPRQLHLIEALYIDGKSLREFAEEEGVQPQAISSRINALANKAPEFYRWWRRINEAHQRRSKGIREGEMKREDS